MTEDEELDRSELEDYVHVAIATALQATSADFPDAARRDFPPESDGRTTLGVYLRSNQVSDHLADAVIASLSRHRLRVVFEENDQPKG